MVRYNKKRSQLVFLLIVLSVSVLAQVRRQVDFNDDWKFKLDDHPRYCETQFDDSLWRTLSLPHDWSVEHEFSEEYSGRNAWLPGGIAWYRKTFKASSQDLEKNIEIQFDGVYKNASVWLNQHLVGIQHDGYTSFRFDISELLTEGENVIAVRVDNSVQPNCRWYSGSGIYRNVWLNITNPTHIETWGTYITTPQVSAEKATVKLTIELVNSDEAKSITVETSIYDASGTLVSLEATEVNVGRFVKAEVAQTLEVRTPTLWSLERPYVYNVLTKIKQGNVLVDEYKSSFGIRTIGFNPNTGFYLNGKNLKMKGVCLHHEAGPLGAAVPDQVWERRLKALKEIGCNAIRTAHNPTSVEFLTMCDTLGFLVMDEFVDKWENPYRGRYGKKNPFYDVPFADKNFPTEWKHNFKETIRRDRNHPCVVIWSVGNENHPPMSDSQNNGLKKLTTFVRSIDNTRPVISGMERGKDMPIEDKIESIIEGCRYMDLIALNYGEQWCKLINEQNPGKPYVSTESYTYFNSALEKRFASIERSPWLDVLDNPSNMGLFLWVGINYLGESKNWGRLGSTSGLFDIAGFRTPRSHLYEAFWSDKPVLHLNVYEGKANDFSTSGRWGWPPMHQNWNLTKDSIVDIVSYTNCEEVDLYLNDKLLGTQSLQDCSNWIMKWKEVSYQPGTLKAVGKIGGVEVCESVLETVNKPHHLKYTVDNLTPKEHDIVHVELYLVDKKGRKVVNDDRRLFFELEGDAEILAVTNGDSRCLEPFYKKDSKETKAGKCLCMLKVGQSKSIKLNVKGEDLRSLSVVIK